MALKNYLEQIQNLKSEIEKIGKLDGNTLQRIQNKFRLEWNYHSNSLEGNSLTKEETQSVMLNNITVEGKPLKDVLEIQGHDRVIKKIQQMASGEIKITENRIKEIHEGIMHEDDEEKKVGIGKWKRNNNYLLNYKGERMDFTPPENVVEEMNQLINWVNNELDAFEKRKSKLSIIEIAAELHLRYVTIHPFYDGNGRTARILMNLVLIRYGYPPIIIKVNEKAQYGQYLAHAQEYEKNPTAFYEMMASLLVRSMELYLKGAQGDDISDADDLDKELQQIEIKLKNEEAKVVKRTPELVNEIFEKSIKPLSDALYEKLIKFNKFFAEFSIHTYMDGKGNSGNKELVDTVLPEYFKKKDVREISISYQWGGFNRAGANTFWLNSSLKIQLNEFDYTINQEQIPDYKQGLKKLYTQQLTQQEIDKIVEETSNKALVSLKQNYKQITGKDL